MRFGLKLDKEQKQLKAMIDDMVDWEMECPEIKQKKTELEEMLGDMLPSYSKHCLSKNMSIQEFGRTTWIAWNSHLHKYDDLMSSSNRALNAELAKTARLQAFY